MRMYLIEYFIDSCSYGLSQVKTQLHAGTNLRRRLYRLLRLTGSTRHKVRHVLDFLAAETLAADLES